MKTCNECGRDIPKLFSKGRCFYCARKSYKTTKSKSNKIVVENVHYLQTKQELAKEWNKKGWNTCTFTGEPLDSYNTPHHIIGRDGGSLSDKDYLIFCNWMEGHYAWHNYTINKFMSMPWYEGFLERLKTRSPKGYIEMLKQIENRIDKS